PRCGARWPQAPSWGNRALLGPFPGSHRFDYFQSELLPVHQDNDNPRPRHGPIGEGVDGAFSGEENWGQSLENAILDVHWRESLLWVATLRDTWHGCWGLPIPILQGTWPCIESRR